MGYDSACLRTARTKAGGIERRLTTLEWMVCAEIALTPVVLGIQFAIWSELADLSVPLARPAAKVNM